MSLKCLLHFSQFSTFALLPERPHGGICCVGNSLLGAPHLSKRPHLLAISSSSLVLISRPLLSFEFLSLVPDKSLPIHSLTNSFCQRQFMPKFHSLDAAAIAFFSYNEMRPVACEHLHNVDVGDFWDMPCFVVNEMHGTVVFLAHPYLVCVEEAHQQDAGARVLCRKLHIDAIADGVIPILGVVACEPPPQWPLLFAVSENERTEEDPPYVIDWLLETEDIFSHETPGGETFNDMVDDMNWTIPRHVCPVSVQKTQKKLVFSAS